MNDATPSSISYDHLTNPVPVLRTFQPSDDSINDARPRISLWNQSLPTVQLWLERHERSTWVFFLQAYHFLFAMYSNLVSVSVIIFFVFSHSYSATTRTRHLEGDYPITTFFGELSRFFANGPITFINLRENIVAN